MIEIEVREIPCAFNEEALRDYEVMEAVVGMSDGRITDTVKVARALFGDEQMDNIKRSLRDDKGVVDIYDVQAFVVEAIQAAGAARKAEAKN